MKRNDFLGMVSKKDMKMSFRLSTNVKMIEILLKIYSMGYFGNFPYSILIGIKNKFFKTSISA